MIASVILVAALFILNLNIIFTFGEYVNQNGTEVFACYALDEAGYWMNVWSTVSKVFSWLRNAFIKFRSFMTGVLIYVFAHTVRHNHTDQRIAHLRNQTTKPQIWHNIGQKQKDQINQQADHLVGRLVHSDDTAKRL